MRQYLIILYTILLASCSEMDLNFPSPNEEEEMGDFALTLTGETAPTRSTTTVITEEDAKNFLITIYKGSDVYRPTARLKDVNTRLSAGYGYSITAESCSEEEAITVNDGWGQRRYAGISESFSIKAGQTTAVSVGCSVANAGVEVMFDPSVPDYFTTSYNVTIHDGDRTIVFDATTGGIKSGDQIIKQGNIAYFNLDSDGHHTITYTITAVGPKTLIKEGTIELNKKKVSRINLNYERSFFDFIILLEEEELFMEERIDITDDDIQVDNGETDSFGSHDNFTNDDTDVDIDDYGKK